MLQLYSQFQTVGELQVTASLSLVIQHPERILDLTATLLPSAEKLKIYCKNAYSVFIFGVRS